jgi:hypothetical protein
MSRVITILFTALSIAGAGRAYGQNTTPGPGTVEVAVFPGGGTFFTSGDKGPSFGSYNVGAALTYNANRVIGIEGEFAGTLGVAQDLQLGGITTNQKPPNLVSYAANLVLAAPTHSSVVPYVTGGIGGLTMFERASVGAIGTENFLTGNAGAGVKWYAPGGHWGVRGDYRFLAVRSNTEAPAFFGAETRYGHRVYGAVIINGLR